MDDCIEWIGSRFSSGYGRKKICGRSFRAHRLVWQETYGPIPDGMDVLHDCDNRICINLNHLHLGTDKDNAAECVARGRKPKGSGKPNSKLTEETAVYAMARMLSGETQRSIAKAFGVSQSAIAHISSGRRWQHVFRDE